MTDGDLDSLNAGPREFAMLLLAVHPELATVLSPYQASTSGDDTEPGSLWVDIGPREDRARITAIVQSREALVTLGGEERLFVWNAPEHGSAHAEVLATIERGLDEGRI